MIIGSEPKGEERAMDELIKQITQRTPLLLQELRRKRLDLIGGGFQSDPRLLIARPRRPEWIGAAPRCREHGKPRLRAAGSHRAQSGNEIIGQPGRFVRDDPAINRQSADRVIAARQRQNA